MKKFFEKLVKGKYPLAGLLIVAFCFTAINLSFNQIEAVTKLDFYIPAINISVTDGTGEATGYLVKQSSVDEILQNSGYTLGDEDYTEPSGDTVLEDGMSIQIYRVTYDTTYEDSAIAYETVHKTGSSSIATTMKSQDGVDGTLRTYYTNKYINGELVSTEESKTEVIQEPVDEVYESNVIKAGATFNGMLTVYGADCAGGSGTTASGCNLYNLYRAGTPCVTYNGKQYYVLAADSSIPMYSIIKIETGGFSFGSCIYGIVLDRGGAIRGNHLDIWCGTERHRLFSGDISYNVKYTIVSVG